MNSECRPEHWPSVHWNPLNRVVQCHTCGRIYIPVDGPSVGETYRQAVEAVYGPLGFPEESWS